MAKESRLWSYSAGKRGASRVRVYERTPGGPIQIEWTLNGKREQRSLQYEVGGKVFDKRDAMRLADRAARRLGQDHNRQMHQILFAVSPQRTIGELLTRMHAARGKKWSGTYAKDQERYRLFWCLHLGADCRLVTVSPAVVEDVVSRQLPKRRPGTRNHYRRYLVEAFKYAETKLKWLDPQHNLSGVDYEAPASEAPSYSRAEVPRLLAGAS
jgi:hypothetical protein